MEIIDPRQIRNMISSAVSPAEVFNDENLWRPEKELCKRNFLYWAARWAKTTDAVSDASNRVRPFPIYLDYLVHLTNEIQQNDKIAIIKSRRMFITWYILTYAVWTAWSSPHSKIIVQSRTETLVEELFKKIAHIVESMPSFLAAPGEYACMSLKAKFKNGSEIIGLASGGSKGASYTATLFIHDEIALTEEEKPGTLDQLLAGALPTIEGGGKFVLISSIRPNRYYDLICDNMKG
jgi:hypothetical protein